MFSKHPEEFVGTYHRAWEEEFENYDSVLEEMRSMFFNYVEAIRLLEDGTALGMFKIGMYGLDPETNGAREIHPDLPGTYNRIGKWSVKGGNLKVRLRRKHNKPVLSEDWVGTFYLPSEIDIVEGGLDKETALNTVVKYDSHPICDPQDTAYYQRLK